MSNATATATRGSGLLAALLVLIVGVLYVAPNHDLPILNRGGDDGQGIRITLSVTWQPSPNWVAITYTIGNPDVKPVTVARRESPWNYVFTAKPGDEILLDVEQNTRQFLDIDCFIHRNERLMSHEHRATAGKIDCVAWA